MHMARGGDAQGGRGDARASCASPLGTPLPIGIYFIEILRAKSVILVCIIFSIVLF